MTPPIFFNMERAREFFLQHGYVYTIRHERSSGITWARHGNLFKFELLAKVQIKKILALSKEAAAAQLAEYVPSSGFGTVQDWLAAVKRWSNPMVLYRVEILA